MQLPMTQLSRTWTDAYTVCLSYKETTVGSFKGQGAALPVGPSHTPCYLDRNKNTSLAATEHQRAGVSQKDPAWLGETRWTYNRPHLLRMWQKMEEGPSAMSRLLSLDPVRSRLRLCSWNHGATEEWPVESPGKDLGICGITRHSSAYASARGAEQRFLQQLQRGWGSHCPLCMENHAVQVLFGRLRNVAGWSAENYWSTRSGSVLRWHQRHPPSCQCRRKHSISLYSIPIQSGAAFTLAEREHPGSCLGDISVHYRRKLRVI